MAPGGSWDLASVGVGFAAAPLVYALAKIVFAGGRATADTKPRAGLLRVLGGRISCRFSAVRTLGNLHLGNLHSHSKQSCLNIRIITCRAACCD